MASPALTRRPGEDRALTVGGRAPPPSARRRAPSSSAGTPRRSIAELASTASYPLALGTCNGEERGPKCQSGTSISPHNPAAPLQPALRELLPLQGHLPSCKEKKKKKTHKKNFHWSLPALTYLGISYSNCVFSTPHRQKRDRKKGKKRKNQRRLLRNNNRNEMVLYTYQ